MARSLPCTKLPIITRPAASRAARHKTLGIYNIGLDAVPAQVVNYEKSGFTRWFATPYSIVRYTGDIYQLAAGTALTSPDDSTSSVVIRLLTSFPLASVDALPNTPTLSTVIHQITDMDTATCGVPRPAFMAKWVLMAGLLTMVALTPKGQILGKKKKLEKNAKKCNVRG